MQEFLNSVTEFVTGKSGTPANPDPAFNVMLLKENKTKIETGVLTRYLQRQLVYILETSAHIITLFPFLACLFFWNKIDNLFDAAKTVNFMNRFFTNVNLIENDYSYVSYCILFALLIPAFISFLLARLLTANRRRTATFIDVENRIDQVIFNLPGTNIKSIK